MGRENETPIDKIIREISADADAGNLVAWTPLGLRQLSYRIAEATMLEREMLRCATAQVRELKARVRELEARVEKGGEA